MGILGAESELFFYRELYQNWHPVYANTYEVYWKKNTTDSENEITSGYDVEIIDINESSKKIIVLSDLALNGIADVYIDFSVKKNEKRSSMLVFQTNLKVENTGTIYAQGGAVYESNYLRSSSKEYIPISVVNGYGEVTLTSEPQRNTTITLNEVVCDRIYTVTSDYVQISAIDVDDNNRVIFRL